MKTPSDSTGCKSGSLADGLLSDFPPDALSGPADDVALSPRCAAIAALRDYIERFRGEAPDSLFLTTRRARPLAKAHALNVILQRIAGPLSLTKVHPHRFRHTFATWAIRAHAREIDVQSLLGRPRRKC